MGTLTEFPGRWEYRGYSNTKLVIAPATKCVRLVDCQDVGVDDLIITGVVNNKMLRIDGCQRLNFEKPIITDGLLDTSGFQVTGIEIDGGKGGSDAGLPWSDDITINRPRIERILATDPVIATWGDQTDAITVANENTRRVRVLHPFINDVGEGFDCFGSRCGIVGGEIHKARVFGIKFIHGATACYAHQTQLCWVGLGGVGVFGSASATRNAERNIIRGVDVRQVNYQGKYTTNDNFAFGTLPGTTTSKATNTIFESCSGDKTAKWDILANAGAGTGNQYLRTINTRPANIANPEGAVIA